MQVENQILESWNLVMIVVLVRGPQTGPLFRHENGSNHSGWNRAGLVFGDRILVPVSGTAFSATDSCRLLACIIVDQALGVVGKSQHFLGMWSVEPIATFVLRVKSCVGAIAALSCERAEWICLAWTGLRGHFWFRELGRPFLTSFVCFLSI